MSLKITENNGKFYLNGKLNNSTLNLFINYFEQKIAKKNNIIVNIDKVKEINKASLQAMRNFNELAILHQKQFSIVGYGCKEIYDDFNQQKVA